MKTFVKDKLNVKIFETRTEMGSAAAYDISSYIKELLGSKDEINMIFAAAPSQNDVLASLIADKEIDWTRVNAYHMDEYIGISADAPQGFAMFLKRAIFEKLPFKSVNLLDCTAEPDAEAERYSKLLDKNPADIVLMGIGENGHIAFNDPPVADFNDTKLVKKVQLDEICRMQQVHDGCFATIDDVPKYALTLTVPALMKNGKHFCVVPTKNKADAVYNTVNGDINERCPATVLRVSDGSVMYCDADSASKL